MTKLNTRELLSEQLTLSSMSIIAHQEKWVIAFEKLMIQGKSCAPERSAKHYELLYIPAALPQANILCASSALSCINN
jgi:hypothetical protein